MLDDHEILERTEIAGGGLDVLARDAEGREVRLWLGCEGSAGLDLEPLKAALARVYHSSLPRVLAAETHDGRAALRFESYRGRRLTDRIAEGPLAAPEAIDIVRAAAAALVKAHAKGVEHGGITAADILLADDGRTLLLHTGFGPWLGDRPPRAPGEAAAVPGAGDVFALSRVLIQALEGADPFPGAEPSPPRDEASFDPALPQGLRRLLARAVAPDAARRMVRAEELAGDLGVMRASWDSMFAPPASPGDAWRGVLVRVGLAAAVVLGAWAAFRALWH
ncbi:MAG: hypothetical protein R3B81_00510 [bacterium]